MFSIDYVDKNSSDELDEKLFIKKRFYTEPVKPYNVISMSLFQLENSYKNNDIYYNGLNYIINNFKKYYPDMYIRLYIDDSVINPIFKKKETNDYIKNKWIPLINRIKKLDYVQVVLYDYKLLKHKEDYHDKANKQEFLPSACPCGYKGHDKAKNVILPSACPCKHGHEGLFGTLIRFEPLFNFKENKNINIVYVSDIDLGKGFFTKRYEGFKKFKRSSCDFYFKCASSMYVKPRFYVLKDSINTWCRITASMIVSKIKLPSVLYTDFIKTLCNRLNNKNIYSPSKLMKMYDKQIDLFLSNEAEKSKTAGYDTIVEYGIDELFMTSVLGWIVESKVKFAYYYNIEFSRVLWNYYNGFKKGEKDKIENNFKYILSKILGKYYNNKKNVDDNYDVIDKLFYYFENKVDYKKDEKFNYCVNNFILLCKELLQNNTFENYGLTKDDCEAILRIIYISQDIEPIDYKQADDRIYYTFKLL